MRGRSPARSFRGLRRCLRRLGRSEPAQFLGAVALLLALPVFLVLALALLPVALLAAAWSERRRPCPNCGLRGTLRDVTPPLQPEHDDDGSWRTTLIPRVVTTRVWRCEMCGATFEGADAQPLRQVA